MISNLEKDISQGNYPANEFIEKIAKLNSPNVSNVKTKNNLNNENDEKANTNESLIKPSKDVATIIDPLKNSDVLEEDSKGQSSINTLVRNSNGNNVNQKPVIYGLRDKRIVKGESFDLLEGVSAVDPEDGPIDKSKVEVSGNVSPKTTGSYRIIYKVKDDDGLYSENHQITIEFIDEVPIFLEKNLKVVKDKKYIYNGEIKRALQSFTFYGDYGWWGAEALFEQTN
ncbi:MAG: immunoglobulin-like domain-containing protein [Mycoplasmatales bacterium]